MKNLFISLLFVAGLALAYLLLSPSPIDSAAYQPPAPPSMDGKLSPNNLLKKSQLLALGQVHGPEDVDVDSEGRVYGSTQDGKIIRVLADGSVEDFAITGGRPCGLHFDAEGNLIVADAYKGLLSIDPTGTITTLLTEAEGVPFKFTDDLDISEEGIIYFTDASSKFNASEYMLDLFEARPYGRLISFNPKTGITKVLMRDLYFGNGVALAKQEDFVLVNETWRYRVLRYWLKGKKAGSHDVFIDNLPGFPDGISSNRRGTFWLALTTTRNANLDLMHPYPWLKNFSAKLPEAIKPKPPAYGLVVALNEHGEVLKSYHDTDGKHIQEVTSVQEHNGFIYLGSRRNDRIGKLKLDGGF